MKYGRVVRHGAMQRRLIAKGLVGRINATETQVRSCRQSDGTDYQRIERALRGFKADVTTDLNKFKTDVTTEIQRQLDAFKTDFMTELQGVKTELQGVKTVLNDVKNIVTGLNDALLPPPLDKIGNYRGSVVGVATSDGGVGTGFIMGNGQRYVLTARQVVVKALAKGGFALLPGRVHPKRGAKVKYTAAWFHVDSNVDIALLEFDEQLNQSQLKLTDRVPPLGQKVLSLTTHGTSIRQLSGWTCTSKGLDALLITGLGRAGSSGSPVGNDEGIFGIVVDNEDTWRKRRTAGAALDEAFANVTSQRGVVLGLHPYTGQNKWFRVPLQDATSCVAIKPPERTATLTKLIDVLGLRPENTKKKKKKNHKKP
jgi:hypothetical protein